MFIKTIKKTIVILLLGTIIFACKDAKKEDKINANEDVETTTNKEVEVKTDDNSNENEGFTYTVNYTKNTKLADLVNSSIKSLINEHPELESEFSKAYGYAIFPKITKAGLGIGGAGGKGLVFENNAVIGLTKLSQATLGFQLGGQQYKQAIFFKNKAALNNFINGKFKFSSEASAVALESGATAGIDYQDGMATIVESEKGAMFEASLGTQKFKFEGGL